MVFCPRINRFLGVVVGAVLLAASDPAGARERREFYTGIRSLGMGGVTVSVVNDETALATNPAALGRVRDFYGTIFDPELDIGARVPEMQRADAFSQPFKLDDVMPSWVTSSGTYYHATGRIFPSFVARNFGIGVLLSNTLSGENLTATTSDVFYRDDMALLLGYNLRLWGGRVKIGFSGKVINRVELNEAALDPTQALDNDSLAAAGLMKEGTGVGADVGLILQAPWTWIPTLAVVAHDMGNTPYDKSPGLRLATATTRPATVVQDIDVGLSISPIHRKNVRSVWGLEYHGLLTAADETDKAKLLHFGTEFNFGDVLFFRLGYNHRYWTAGAELASERFQFQLATYGTEVGDETNPREDRRMVGKMSFRF